VAVYLECKLAEGKSYKAAVIATAHTLLAGICVVLTESRRRGASTPERLMREEHP
jgi:hypothetical protein